MQNIDIMTEDNYRLSAHIFTPSSSPKAGVIINSATAVPQGYYTHFAKNLSEQGFLVITYDYRGIGASRPKKMTRKAYTSSQLSVQAWGEQDCQAVIQWASTEHAALTWHCIGHSVGGQLPGLARSNHRLNSIYAIASQSGYWGHWGWRQKPKLLLAWFGVMPACSKVLGYVPSVFMGHPLPAPIARQWARWCRHPDYIVDENGQPIRQYFHQYTDKMRFIAITDDLEFAPLKAVKALQSFYKNADSDVHTLDPKTRGLKTLGHFGFFREQHRTVLWPDVLEWLNSQSS